MIAHVFALALQTANPVIEVREPGARFVSVQALVELPELSARERSAAALLAETITQDVEGYSRFTMRDLAAQAGDRLRVMLMPDHLRIQIGVPREDLNEAITYVHQVLTGSKFPEDAVQASATNLAFRSRGTWDTALQPYGLLLERMRREEVLNLYRKICRADRVRLAVGGDVASGRAGELWRSRLENWKPAPVPRTHLDDRPAPQVRDLAGRLSAIELVGPEIPGGDAALSAKLLAVIALGSGKGSTMFEVLREAQGWSYRQEAVLWPTLRGFRPRFIMLSGADLPLEEVASGMRKQLKEAVEKWTKQDLQRARGMAEGILERGAPMSPFYFQPGGPVGDSLHDRTFLAAYWPMKTGNAWNPKKLRGDMALAELTEVREAALEMIERAIPSTLPARR